MRKPGRMFGAVSAALALACGTLVSVAFAMPLTVSPGAGAAEIGDARVALGELSARVVEQVSYAEGIERIADVILIDGQPNAPIDDPDVVAAWDIVDRMWPDSIRSSLSQLSVVSEGPRGLVGVVHLASDGRWILSLDAADLGDVGLVEETIAHEIAHIATLSVDNFTFGSGSSCDGVAIPAGCAASDSLMARFAQEFWPDPTIEPQPSDYVDDYASTAPHEDVAETFTAWVFGWPVGSAEVEAKMAMLSADPQMAGLALELLERLG